MISLRSVISAASAALAMFAVACSDGPVQPLSHGAKQPSGASFDGKVGDVGNAAKNGDIDVRVLLDKGGNALLQIRTGTYNPTTNVAIPSGYFQSIQYKVYNASGKQVAVRNVKFNRDGVSLYSAYIDLCSSAVDDNDDNDNHLAGASSCATKYSLSWSVSVQADLKDVNGDKKKTDVVREDGLDGYLPDIDIATQPVYIVASNGTPTPIPAAGAGIPAAAPVSYSVSIPNNKAINGVANSTGTMVTCLVSVDNKLQLAVPNIPIAGIYPNPNLFAYGVGGPTQPIPAGTTATCNFSLSLPAGAHTISVSALVLAPGDFDLTNNSTAKFTVTASSGPPDVAVLGGLKKLVGTTYSDVGALALASANTPITTTVYQQVEQKSLTNPGAVTCKFNVDGTDVGTSTVSPALGGVTSTGYCGLPITLSEGSHVVKVTVVTTGDSDASNNVATTTVLVAAGPVSATLGSALYLTNSGKVALTSSAVDLMSGTTNAYSADVTVSSLANTAGPIPVTCSVVVDNMTLIPGVAASIGTSAVLLTWVTPGGVISVSNGATVPCNFTLKMTEAGNADVVHVIKVTAATNVTATPTSTTATGSVKGLVRVDLQGVGMKFVTGGVLVAPTTLPLGTTQVVSMVFRNPDPSRSVTFNCTVTGDGTLGSAYTPIALTNVTAGPNGTGECRWSVSPVTLQSLGFIVTAKPVASSPQDPDLSNNTITDVVKVKSNGTFSSFDAQNTSVLQEWYMTAGSASGFPIQALTIQVIQVTKLALLVVPTGNGQIGTFTLTGQVSTPGATFPAGVTTGFLTASPDGNTCSIQSGPRTFVGAAPAGFPSQYGFTARICTEPTTLNGASGYQQVTVTYVQSVDSREGSNPIVNPGIWAVPQGTVDVKMRLDFQLTGNDPDFVSGTIRIPTGSAISTGHISPMSWPILDGKTQWLFVNDFAVPCVVGAPTCTL